MSEQELKNCPHCGGRTKCACATCGTPIPTYKGFQQNGVRMKEGICQVCGGTGKVKL